jgi:cell division control protein 6
LRIAAEIAERGNEDHINEAHVYKAKNKIELDCVTEAVKTLPTQSKLVLLGILIHEEKNNGRLTTGDVYETYRDLCKVVGLACLTQRRVTDLISELDMLHHPCWSSHSGAGDAPKKSRRQFPWPRRSEPWRRTRSSRC